MDLSKDLRDVIEKHLPAEAGGLVQERLQQADILEEALASKIRLVASRDDIIEALKADNTTLQQELEKHEDIDDRIEGLARKQIQMDEMYRDLSLNRVQHEFKAEQRITSMLMETIRLLTRNTEYRKELTQANGSKNMVKQIITETSEQV